MEDGSWHDSCMMKKGQVTEEASTVRLFASHAQLCQGALPPAC